MRRLVLVALVALAPTVSVAPAAAQAWTLGHVVDSLRVAARLVKLESTTPHVYHELEAIARAVEVDGVAHWPVARVASAVTVAGEGTPPVTLGVVARTTPRARTMLFRDNVFALKAIANIHLMEQLEDAVGRARADSVLTPYDVLDTAITRAANLRVTATLKNFERKYGPGSPQLNALEVLLNLGAQHVPPFRTTERSGPSPLEIIAAYHTTDLKVGFTSDDPPRLVSGARLGLRYYVFRDGWGEGGRLGGYLKPGHVSLGLFTMGPDDEPLMRAWGRGYRAGPFIGYGSVHAAWLVDRRSRFIIGMNRQLVPLVF